MGKENPELLGDGNASWGRVEEKICRLLADKLEKIGLRGGIFCLNLTKGEVPGEKRHKKKEWNSCVGEGVGEET